VFKLWVCACQLRQLDFCGGGLTCWL
jgi:hypothetical protein